MSAPYNIILYGANLQTTCESTSQIDLVSVNMLSGLTSVDMTCYFVEPKYEHDGEEFQAGNIKYRDGLRRQSFNIQSEFYRFPDEADTIHSIETVLNKQFHWLENVDFPYSLHSDDKVLAVTIDDDLSLEQFGKQFKISCKKLKSQYG